MTSLTTRKMEIPRMSEQDHSFDIALPYTPCGKNHTFHTEDWPTSGTISISKCERQCRFRACKAWSQTAAALRKHVNAHILNNNLNLRIIPATNGREPLRIVPENDISTAVAMKNTVSAPVSTPEPMSFASFSSSAASNQSDSGYGSPKSSIVRLDVEASNWEWDGSPRSSDWGTARKRHSNFLTPVPQKRFHVGTQGTEPLIDSSSSHASDRLNRPSLTDLVEQVMGMAQKESENVDQPDLLRAQLATSEHINATTIRPLRSEQPDVTEDTYIHRLDNLMARVQQLQETSLQESLAQPTRSVHPDAVAVSPARSEHPEITEDSYMHRLDNLLARVQQLRETSLQASLTTSVKERSPFREGSPLAPSRSSSRGSISNVLVEHQQSRHRSSPAVKRQTTISPKLMGLEYHENESSDIAMERPQLQGNAKPPASHEFFGLVDFSTTQPSLSTADRKVKDHQPSESVERPSVSIHSVLSTKSEGVSSPSHTVPDQIYEEWTSYVRKLNEEGSAEHQSSVSSPGERKLDSPFQPAGSWSTYRASTAERPFQHQDGSKYGEAFRRGHSLNSESQQIPPNDRLQCPTCLKLVLTRADLKKHDLRHKKAFRCGLPGCTRTDGLSTANDLARHIKSKHPTYAPSEIVRRYKCHFPGCKSKDKTWPRLDNFRTHLKRVHLYHLTEIGAENVVHGAESAPSDLDSEELEPGKRRTERPADVTPDDQLDFQSLHVLADSAVFGHLYNQWPPKDDSSKSVV